VSDDQIKKEKQAKEQQQEKERREKKLKDAKIIFVVGGPGSGKVMLENLFILNNQFKKNLNQFIKGNSMRKDRREVWLHSFVKWRLAKS